MSPDDTTRITLLENRVDGHEERITEHGKEIDDIERIVTEMRTDDKHRDATMCRIEGKVDTLVMKPAESYDKLKWLVIGGLTGVITAFLLSTVGIG